MTTAQRRRFLIAGWRSLAASLLIAIGGALAISTISGGLALAGTINALFTLLGFAGLALLMFAGVLPKVGTYFCVSLSKNPALWDTPFKRFFFLITDDPEVLALEKTRHRGAQI